MTYVHQATQTPVGREDDEEYFRPFNQEDAVYSAGPQPPHHTCASELLRHDINQSCSYQDHTSQTAAGVPTLSIVSDKMTSFGEYKYAPLDGPRQIRLIKVNGIICPGTLLRFVSDIEIEHYDLDETPPFSCLSYVWGDPSPVAHLQVGPGGQDGSLPITQSLVDALPNLFSLAQEEYDPFLETRGDLKETSYFWVDQLCIRQNCNDPLETTEKSMQVQLMGEIFLKATRTFVWVQANEETHLRAAYFFGKLTHRLLLLIEAGDEVGPRYWYEVTRADSEQHKLFRCMATQSFNHRAWIVQELALSRELIYLSGTGTVIRELWDLSMFSQTHNIIDTFLVDEAKDALKADNTEDIKSRAFMTLVEMGRGRWSAREPRDHLLAYVGIWKPSSFKANYEIDVDDLYMNWARSVAADIQSMQFLCLGGIPKADRGTTLPSWTPNWHQLSEGYSRGSISCEEMPPVEWRASGSTPHRSQANSQDGYRLEVRGKLLSSIKATYLLPKTSVDSLGTTPLRWQPIRDVFVHLFGLSACLELMESFAQPVESGLEPYEFSCRQHAERSIGPARHQLEFSRASSPLALAQMLIKISMSDKLISAGSFTRQDIQSWLEIWQNEPTSRSIWVEDDSDVYQMRTKAAILTANLISERIIVLFSNNMLGVARQQLAEVEACDADELKLAIIHGCTMPLILKETTRGDLKEYQVVSDAYVDGGMKGELMTWDEEDADTIILV